MVNQKQKSVKLKGFLADENHCLDLASCKGSYFGASSYKHDYMVKRREEGRGQWI